jgi:hypothetical protein
VAVKLQDAAGNALTYTYCNSATAIAEVCDGFDDNCDGVIPASEADLDDDSWSSCNGDDCDDTNGWVWAAPGEVAGLRFLDHNLMEWNTTQTGSLPGTANYNVLRSSTPQNFLTLAVCVFSFDGTEPAPGAIFYYQVRARNDCPNGLGSLGTRSDGTPRVGRSCP